MQPIVLQDDGSNSITTTTQFDLRTAKDYYELAEYLASRFANYWGMQKVEGVLTSVDQEFAWRGECARVNADGLILLTRHTSGNNRIIAVMLSKPAQDEGQATEVVNGASFDTERLEVVMRDAAREWWAKKGIELGKETFGPANADGHRQRRWVKL